MGLDPPKDLTGLKVNIVSSGHLARDHRLFDKEARSLVASGTNVNVIALHEKEEVVDGIQIVPIIPSQSRLKRFLILPWKCFFAGLNFPSDVWHIQDIELLVICPFIRMLNPKTVIIYDRHEDFDQLINRRDWIPRGFHRIFSKLTILMENMLVCNVDGIVTVSTFLTRRFSKKPSIAIYNFPSKRFFEEVDYFSLAMKDRPYHLVHLGVLSKERMLFLVATIKLLNESVAGFQAVLAGVSPEQKDELDDIFIGKQILVLTRVPYEKIPRILGQAKVGINIHPILYPHLLGALPVKVIEYMAAGCSVVSSSLPELENLTESSIQDGLRLMKSENPQEYVDVILSLLNNKRLLKRNQSILSQYVHDHLLWEPEGEKLVNFYIERLSEKSSK